MKKSILYLLAALSLSVGFTSCDDDFERPPLICDAEGDGTFEHPFNALSAIWKAQQTGTTPTEESYFVGGYVVYDESSSTDQGIDPSFGNATWYICNTPVLSDQKFEIYRCYDFNGAKFTDKDKVKEGDYIVVYGKIVNHNGKYPELTQGGRLISINGVVGGDVPADPVAPGKPEGDGSKTSPFNASAAVEKAKEVGETASTEKYYIKGFVASGSIDPSFGNATFVLADSKGGSGIFTAYRFYDVNGAKFTDADKIKIGDEIVIYASVVNYKGNTPETAQGGQLVSVNGSAEGGSETPDTPEVPGDPAGNGTVDSPFNCAAAVAKAYETGTTATTGKYYVKGYVIDGKGIDLSYGDATFKLADTADGEGVFTAYQFRDFSGEKFTSADKIKAGDLIVVYGSIVNYNNNTPELAKGGILYSLNGSVEGEIPGDDPTPPTPPTGEYKGDFNSFNGGAAKSSYGTYTNATGWTATNCNVLAGTDGADSNPYFGFIGSSKSVLAVCLNGKTGAAGVVTSPVLTGGIKTLTFNYGFPYNEKYDCAFTVKVKKGGETVKTVTVNIPISEYEKLVAKNFSCDVNVDGDFQIEIVNDCVAGVSDSNVGRVAIWNLTWD